MKDDLRRLTVSVSHGVPESQVYRGVIGSIFGLAIAPVFGCFWLIGVVLVVLCHLHAWDTDPTRELSRLEVFLRSHRKSSLFLAGVFTLVILALLISYYPLSALLL